MDKLTAALTIKMTQEDLEDLRALADANDMEASEYMRSLFLADRSKARRQFEALNRIFGHERATGKENRG